MPAALSVRCSVTSTGSSFQLHTRGGGGGGVYFQCCMPATVKRHQCHLSSGLTHPSTTHSKAATASRHAEPHPRLPAAGTHGCSSSVASSSQESMRTETSTMTKAPTAPRWPLSSHRPSGITSCGAGARDTNGLVWHQPVEPYYGHNHWCLHAHPHHGSAKGSTHEPNLQKPCREHCQPLGQRLLADAVADAHAVKGTLQRGL